MKVITININNNMSIESIIGITSGLIAIVGAAYGRVCWLKRKLKECPTLELFERLTRKELSDANRRDILKKLNKSSHIQKRIKEKSFIISRWGHVARKMFCLTFVIAMT